MIAHLDADSFFASVLLRKHPSLKGKPLLAVGMGGGCVIAATYEAKAKGVKTGMRLKEARMLAPNAVEMPADFRETSIASAQIESILKDLCPLVEQMSIDEWFLDLSSLVGGSPNYLRQWAKEVRERILQATDLSMSVGVAPSKLLAKMASEYRKPGGITIVDLPSSLGPPERTGSVRAGGEVGGGSMNIEEFLKDRPAAAIPGIGKQRSTKTDAAGIVTAWDFAQRTDEILTSMCGKQGREMKRELLGDMLFPVRANANPPKSISRCRTFRATTDTDLLKAHLLKHLEYCTMKMRRQGLVCREISIHLRTADYVYAGMHHRFERPCSTAEQMMPAALMLLADMTKNRAQRNQIGLALLGLVPIGMIQQSIFEDLADIVADERLQAALDDIQTRFGRDSVTRATALSVKSGTVKGLDFSIID